jgi:hypothetical protein
MRIIPIIQGYRRPPEPIRRCPCLTTELVHRTNSFGLPHVMELLEKKENNYEQD